MLQKKKRNLFEIATFGKAPPLVRSNTTFHIFLFIPLHPCIGQCKMLGTTVVCTLGGICYVDNSAAVAAVAAAADNDDDDFSAHQKSRFVVKYSLPDAYVIHSMQQPRYLLHLQTTASQQATNAPQTPPLAPSTTDGAVSSVVFINSIYSSTVPQPPPSTKFCFSTLTLWYCGRLQLGMRLRFRLGAEVDGGDLVGSLVCTPVTGIWALTLCLVGGEWGIQSVLLLDVIATLCHHDRRRRSLPVHWMVVAVCTTNIHSGY